MVDRITTDNEIDRLVEFLTSHLLNIGEATMTANDHAIAAHNKLSVRQRLHFKQLMYQLGSSIVEGFRLGRDFGRVNTEPVREMAGIYADSGFVEQDVALSTTIAIKTAMRYVFEHGAENMLPGLMEFASYNRPAARVFNQVMIPEFRARLLEPGSDHPVRLLAGNALIRGNMADPTLTESDLEALYSIMRIATRADDDRTEYIRSTWRRVADDLNESDVYWALADNDLVLIYPHSLDTRSAEIARELAAQRLNAPCWATISPPVSASGIPAAAAECEESLCCIQRLGYLPRVYESRAILFERIVLTADPALLHKARELLQDVLSQPKLAETLHAWIAHNARRGATAQYLGIHPRTLDYRLRRMRAVTELDPADCSTLPLLRTAAIAWSADR
ncbi:PucR family transcriptional regulator [Nocardia vinacea]|uniref:PucR family transcriptional regulator n=1 Tax=Nocardia vinacea TaxID=96468 RepID=UPI0002D90394|nr:helix-turn-helix domain-containing protein [Nocardia vinacea]